MSALIFWSLRDRASIKLEPSCLHGPVRLWLLYQVTPALKKIRRGLLSVSSFTANFGTPALHCLEELSAERIRFT